MGGLLGLFDDIAALVRIAAASADDVATATGKATSKAAGLLVDDAAVLPGHMAEVVNDRELPIIKRVAIGSLRTKLLFVAPALLLLSAVLPAALTPLLVLGGLYLAYEGAHKIHGKLTHTHEVKGHEAEVLARDEDEVVAGALKTDTVLSAEILTIALNEVSGDTGLAMQAVVLVIVSILVTILIYGAVALIVRTDNVGLRLINEGGSRADLGRRLVRAMPKIMAVLTVVGTFMMLVVSGHIFAEALHVYEIDAPYDLLHEAADFGRAAPGLLGGAVGWVLDAVVASGIGLVVGMPLAFIVPAVQKALGRGHH